MPEQNTMLWLWTQSNVHWKYNKEGDKIHDLENQISIHETSDSEIATDKEVTVYYTPDFMLIVDVKNSTSFNYKKI